MEKKFAIVVMVIVLLAMFPSSGAQAQAAIVHPFDNSVLLMISSHMRLDGEVQSAVLPGGHVLALSQQADVGDEIDVLISLYANQIAKLRASDEYDPTLEDKLVNQLEEKVKDLQEKAQALKARRSRGRRGLFGFINRGLKALGRGTGWLLGNAMEGAGKVAEFAIEDVAPKVLKEAVLNGAPLNAALVKRVARELLKRRVNTLFEREMEKLAERISRGREAAYDDGVPTVDPTWEADFMEEFEEGDESQNPQGNTGDSAGGSSVGDIATYDFTLNDAINDWQSWGNEFSWSTYWMEVEGDGYCMNQAIKFDQANIHLEFNRAEMTVSGYLEASGQGEGNSIQGLAPWNASASIRVEFSDLPGDPDFTPLDYIAWSFVGSGYGTGSISGTVTCSQYSEAIKDRVYLPTSATLSHNREEYYIRIDLYQPGQEFIPEETIEVSGGNGWGGNGWGTGWSLDFNQPIDVPPP